MKRQHVRVWIMEFPGGDIEVWATQDLAQARRKYLRAQGMATTVSIHPRFVRDATWDHGQQVSGDVQSG